MEFVDYNGNDINILTEDRVSENIVLNSSFQVWDLPDKTITGTAYNEAMCANGWMLAGTATNVSNGISFKSLSTQLNSLTQYLRIDKDLLIDKTLSFSISINNVIYSITGKMGAYSDPNTTADYALCKIISGSAQSSVKSGIITFFSDDFLIVRYFNDNTTATNVINWIKLEVSDKPTKYNPDPIKDNLSHNFIINIGAWINSFNLRGDGGLFYIKIPYNNILGAKYAMLIGAHSIELSGYRPNLVINTNIDSSRLTAIYVYNNYIEPVYNNSGIANIELGDAIFTTDTYFCVY